MPDHRKATFERSEAANRPKPREKAEVRDGTSRQSTPEGEPDDTLVGEGSPGLTIMGGGGHA
jgi:hypothetical protein